MRSYLIQNFKKRSVIYRWTPKRSLNWLLSNYHILYLISLQMMSGEWRTLLSLTPYHTMQILFKYVFSKSLIHKTTQLLEFKNHPVAIRSFNLMKYWALRSSVTLVERGETSIYLPVRYAELHHNRYYVTTPFLLVRATRKLLRSSLWKFLVLTTLTWSQWSRRQRFTQQHVHLYYNFYILRFLNVYYCKIYNF